VVQVGAERALAGGAPLGRQAGGDPVQQPGAPGGQLGEPGVGVGLDPLPVARLGRRPHQQEQVVLDQPAAEAPLVQGAVADAAHHRVGELQLQLRSRRRAQALGQAAGVRGLLLPTGFRADRRSWARLRKRVFRDPPRQRNRVWQMDFSEFETARGGIWRISAVINYATHTRRGLPRRRTLRLACGLWRTRYLTGRS
jgi:hypothetical protein